MPKDFSTMEDSNRSSNPSIHEVSNPSRRQILKGGFAGAVTGLLAPLSSVAALQGCASLGSQSALIGFKSVPATQVDGLFVAEGYTATPA